MKIFLILLLTCFALLVHSKVVTRKFYPSDIASPVNVLFMTKFDFGPNGGNIRFQVMRKSQFAQSYLKLMVEVVLDSQKEQYLQAVTCQQRRAHVFRKEQLTLYSKSISDMRNMVIGPLGRQQIYYVYWAKCDNEGLSSVQNQNQNLRFQISMYNDGSHFGQDENVFLGYITLVVIWIVLLIKFAVPLGKIIINSNDKTKIISFGGLIVLGFSYFYRLLHIGIYYSNGEGIYFFEVLYIILKTPCEFIIITLFVAVGWGWSITHLSHDESYIVAGIAAGLINTICMIINGSADEMVDNHHKYDSTPGNILLALRILILIIFLVGVLRIYNRELAPIRKFMKKLGAIGGLYLASWPITVIFAEFFLPNYMHNKVITFVQEITHLIATWLLCSMFSHPESTYRKISIKQEDDPLRMQNYKRK